MKHDPPVSSQATVRVLRGHARCYSQALTDTLTQVGVPSPMVEITTRPIRVSPGTPGPAPELELVIRVPELDQFALDWAVRRTAPDCHVGGSDQDSSHPCLVANMAPTPDGAATVVAPLDVRQDATVPGALSARHEQTIEEPLALREPPTADVTLEHRLPLPTAASYTEVAEESAPSVPAPVPAPAAERAPTRYNASELLKLAGLVIAVFLGLRSVMQTFRVDGPSMNPNFESGQTLIVNRVAYWYSNGTPFDGLLPVRTQGSVDYLFGGPQRGDIVVFRPPGESNFESDLLKRIIGLPGDIVSIQSGVVFVNGNTLVEPYVRFAADYTYPGEDLAVRVPADSYFVLGDNRPESADSHLGWLVPAEKLVGEAWLSYWPPGRWGLIRRGEAREVPPTGAQGRN